MSETTDQDDRSRANALIEQLEFNVREGLELGAGLPENFSREDVEGLRRVVSIAAEQRSALGGIKALGGTVWNGRDCAIHAIATLEDSKRAHELAISDWRRRGNEVNAAAALEVADILVAWLEGHYEAMGIDVALSVAPMLHSFRAAREGSNGADTPANADEAHSTADASAGGQS